VIFFLACNIIKKLAVNNYRFGHFILILSLHYLVHEIMTQHCELTSYIVCTMSMATHLN